MPAHRLSVLLPVAVSLALAGAHAAVPVSPPTAKAARARSAKPTAHAAKPAPKLPDGKDWKVDVPHGPHRTVAFDTDEATWMTVDLSPDGTTFVLDILGDLYSLPVAGGEAKRLTSGLAYDCHPRWSPDGKLIAFTSDRGGCDALWVMKPDGTGARQVSHDDEVTVSCPAWSSDGQYLVGRKRLTDTSSLGTVELWLYHLDGGKGVALTKKADLPDANDPVFSPDGRWLYYSARGARFQYDRNPLQGIWQVKRQDTVTGEAVALTSASGGSCRPEVSHDGRTLALVRRDRASSILVLHDLATGSERTLYRGLDHDLQEGFAQGGTYPWFCFAPDDRTIYVWAGGHVTSVDVATGSSRVIPFHAHVEQTVVDALRFPVNLHGDTFETRINRWPEVSPDGSTLVFSALGRLWQKHLGGGAGSPGAEPRPLADLQERDYCPSFTRDGRSILFTSWRDADGGGYVRRMPAGGGAPVNLTTVPGQVANPVASPDGSHVAYVRGSGSTLRGQDLTEEVWFELHVVDADGREDRFVRTIQNRGSSRRMPRPSWSADGTRIYYQDDVPGDDHAQSKTVLRSVKLDGTDRRDHLLFPYAEEIVVSPDEKWVAVNEQHDAWLVPLPREGQGTVEESLDGSALPRVRLTNEGGEWPRFSPDGAWLSWASGPVFHRARVADLLAFAATKASQAPPPSGPGDKKKPDAPADALPLSESIPFGLAVPAWRPHGSVAYEHARILTMVGDEVIPDGTVLVKDDRLEAVGPSSRVSVPADAQRVDLTGRTVMPGFVDVHAHLHYGALDIFPERDWRHDANLAYGVTTVHDPSASTHEVFGLAEMVRAGTMVGPRIFSTGFILYGADSANNAVIHSLDDARHHVRRMKSFGAITVKSYMQPGRDQRQWVLEAAREEGMMVVPEGGGHYEMDMSFVLDGHTGIEHALPVTPLYHDTITLLSHSQSGYTPTLLVAYGGLAGEDWFYQHADVWKDAKLLTFVPKDVVDARARRRTMAPDDDWHHVEVAASAKKVVEAGGSVQLGAHGQLQGLGAHWEMWSMAQGGMTPSEVLHAGTIAGAHYLGLDGEIGTLEAGKLADFIVLKGDPLRDIHDTNTVEQVVIGGRRLDAATLDELWPTPSHRPPYLWQRQGTE